MDNEVKRFFDSIKFSSDLFNGVTVKKVIYNKNKQSYNVNLLCPNIIENVYIAVLLTMLVEPVLI